MEFKLIGTKASAHMDKMPVVHSVCWNVAGTRPNRYRMPDKSTEVFTIWSSRPAPQCRYTSRACLVSQISIPGLHSLAGTHSKACRLASSAQVGPASGHCCSGQCSHSCTMVRIVCILLFTFRPTRSTGLSAINRRVSLKSPGALQSLPAEAYY